MGQRSNGSIHKVARDSQTSGLEMKLDGLRKELSSTHGGIFPHAVLSTQQISILSTQKPTSITQVRLGFSVWSWTFRVEMYRTIPVLDRYGSVLKYGSGPEPWKLTWTGPVRIALIRYRSVRTGMVRFSLVRDRSGSGLVRSSSVRFGSGSCLV